MTECNNKINQRCEKLYAPCMSYELEIPTFSDLYGKSCVSIEDTTKDLYEIVGEIKDEIDLSELGQLCLTYVIPTETAKVNDILLKYESEICNLKTKLEELESRKICDYLITNCDIDLTGISDECENPIQTIGELLQYLILK